MSLEIYFTDRDALAIASGQLTPTITSSDAAALLDAELVPDRMPFLITGDGRYDHVLNDFLRQLPETGCPSHNTWKAYAYALLVLHRHIDAQGGRKILEATIDDFKALYKQRRVLGTPPAITASSWNANLAAYEKFFDWAVSEGYVATKPFEYRSAKGRAIENGKLFTNKLFEKVDEEEGEDIKCVTHAEYEVFREVGLLGRCKVGGDLDPAFRGRNRQRNEAVSEFLLNTGTRVNEAVCLLMPEIPRSGNLAPGSTNHRMALAPYTTKRRKGRKIYVSDRVLTSHVWPYIEHDRANALAKPGWREDLPRRLIATSSSGSGRCQLADGSKSLSFAMMDECQRRRLYQTDASGRIVEPLMVFLTETGVPTTSDNVRAFFQRACDRCKEKRYEIDISPHTLRHTYAVCMLTQLIRVTLRAHRVGAPRARDARSAARELFDRITLDPVRRVQRLLGHASSETTQRYLTHIEEAETLVDKAFSAWDRVLAPPLILDDDDEDEA